MRTQFPHPRSPSGLLRRPIRSAGWRWRSRMRPRILMPPAGGCTSAVRGAETSTPSGWVMSADAERFVAGLVLAAGGAKRLGRPKQLLRYRNGTLLGHVLEVARACRFDQTLCVVGGASGEVRGAVDFAGLEVVENREFGEGCSSSIAAALGAVDPRAD